MRQDFAVDDYLFDLDFYPNLIFGLVQNAFLCIFTFVQINALRGTFLSIFPYSGPPLWIFATFTSLEINWPGSRIRQREGQPKESDCTAQLAPGNHRDDNLAAASRLPLALYRLIVAWQIQRRRACSMTAHKETGESPPWHSFNICEFDGKTGISTADTRAFQDGKTTSGDQV